MLTHIKPEILEGAGDSNWLPFCPCNAPLGPSPQETLLRMVKHQPQAPLSYGTHPGKVDLIGFAHSGVYIVQNQFKAHQLRVLEDFGYNESWRIDRHLRLMSDTTGDGNLDIVGFGEEGVMVAINRGNNTFDPPTKVTGLFSYGVIGGGWRIEKHPRFMIDLRNTGRTDIVGFGETRVLLSLNNGDGTFGPLIKGLQEFSCASGWEVAKHPRFLVDLNGNGLPDIIGFGYSAVHVAFSKGGGGFYPISTLDLHDFTYDSGWRTEKHPRFLADLTGDGRPDIIGFGDRHVIVSLNNGQGLFQPSARLITQFTYQDSWRVEKHLRFVVDLTGNKCADIVGFGEDGVWVSLNNGDGTFQTPYLAHTEFGYNTGWRVAPHPRFAVDLTGDGCADLVGFRGDMIYVAYNEGEGSGMFGKAQKLMEGFGDGEGWTMETIRMVATLRK